VVAAAVLMVAAAAAQEAFVHPQALRVETVRQNLNKLFLMGLHTR
jgi:hypothetical protein